MKYRKLMKHIGESGSLHSTWRSIKSPHLETFDAEEVRNELCSKTGRFVKSLSVGENLQPGTIKEKLPISVSLRHFKTSRVKRVWRETERGTYKITAWQEASHQQHWVLEDNGARLSRFFNH